MSDPGQHAEGSILIVGVMSTASIQIGWLDGIIVVFRVMAPTALAYLILLGLR